MKALLNKKLYASACMLMLMLFPKASGQDSISQKSQMLDIKLQLLDSKLDLLDSKIKLWETKPKELDARLTEIDSRVRSMDFDPRQMTRKLNELDSLVKTSKVEYVPVEVIQQTKPEEKPVISAPLTSSIMLDPVRLMEGTFYLSYERIISSSLSVNIGGMATYATSEGISNYFFSNQKFSMLNSATNDYVPYNGDVMSGGGLHIQLRNYLMANHPGRRQAPLGLYAAPQIMYRRIQIKGNYDERVEVEAGRWEWQQKEVIQHLNIYAGGVILGFKLPLFNALAVDVFAGGNIKLSSYANEGGFTKYKSLFNIDFSGVSPVAGIAVGILK